MNTTLGRQLREARERAGLTQAQAAALAGMHGRQEVHRYESRPEQVSTGRLDAYARLLGLTLRLEPVH